MESKVNYRIVGLFSIVFLACFVVAVFWFGKFGIQNDYDKYKVLSTESVSGLNVEAPVKYRGVVVGSVIDIKINAQNTEKIELVLKIKKGTPIKTTSVASLKPQGITGLNFMDITPGGNGTMLLKDASGEDIPTIIYGPSLFSKVDSSFTSMTERVQSILDKFDTAMSDKNMNHLSQTIQNLSAVSEKLSSRLDEIGEITKNSKDLPHESKEAIKKLSAAAEGINLVAKKIDTAIKRGDFDYKKDITALTNEAKKLLEELGTVSRESDVLIKDIQKSPSSLLFDSSSIPKGPGE